MLEIQAKFLFLAARLSALNEMRDTDRHQLRTVAHASDFVRLRAPVPLRTRSA